MQHSIVAETRRGFAVDTAGTTAIEYGLAASGIALASSSAVAILGEELVSMSNDILARSLIRVLVD